ncbi:hypothetical protein ACFL2H_13805 [Planctomycetota bacterium]
MRCFTHLDGPNNIFSFYRERVDLVDWDDSLSMSIGLLARITGAGLGEYDGYLFGYDTASENIFVNRVDNDAGTPISPNGESVPVVLDPSRDYRMVFNGDGPNFVGQVYDLDNLNAPLATINGTDATYMQGESCVLD